MWIDASPAARGPESELLDLSRPQAVKAISVGYDSLLADVYWARAIQYFGNKVLDNPRIVNTRTSELPLLYPLLDTATTLDPRLIQAYRFGGFFVHDYVDPVLGQKLLLKGIENNPNDARLYQDLAFLYWSNGDCESASRTYAEGAKIPGAPPWMKEMSAIILARCGRADLTAELLRRQYESTDDPRIRERLATLLEPYVALSDVTFLNRAVAAYHERFGSYPRSLADMLRALTKHPGGPQLRLDANGTPVDPKGVPYRYDPSTGTVTTDPKSVALPRTAPEGPKT
jgi:hypothetical protein